MIRVNLLSGFPQNACPWSQFLKTEHPQTKQKKATKGECRITSIALRSQKSLSCSENRTETQSHVADEVFTTPSVINRDIKLQPPPTPAPTNHSPALKVVHGDVGNAYSKRVMARLSRSEDQEVLVSFRDDYRIAWLTVLHASEGMLNAWEFSFWQYLGKHPDKLIPEFVKRDERHRMMEVPDYDPAQDKRRA